MESSVWQKTLERVGKETHRNNFPNSNEVNRFLWESSPQENDALPIGISHDMSQEGNNQGEGIIESIDKVSSYPPGFSSRDTAGIAQPPYPSTPENEPALPVFLNLENTNFISENSLHSILRNAQDTDGFRQDQAPLSPVLFTPPEGVGNDDTDGANNNAAPWSDPYFLYRARPEPIETIEPQQKNWDNVFVNDARGHTEVMSNHFFGNTSPRENRHAILGNKSLDNDLGFLDMSSELDVSKNSNSFNSNSELWDSPTRGGMNNNMQQQQQFTNPATTMASRLTSRECVQLIQSLGNSLSECKESDSFHASQILGLMQLIQGQLITEIQSPISSQSPTTPRHSSTSSSDSPVERAAKYHREIAVSADAVFTWSGQLPVRMHRNPTYSCKIFLGGVPFDITENALIHAFKPFGNVKIEWPGKEPIPSQPKGYLYVIFEHENQVKNLLQNCFLDYSKSVSGDWYFKLTSKRFREKDVQVIPWALSDSNYVKCQAAKIDAKKTIFVGALHGMLNAEGLAKIMNDLFDGVVYAGIDTDRHKYPIGSGRVTFNSMKSYMKAVSAAFVEIKTKFRKKVQVDPYLEDATCTVCNLQQGPYFCREWCCFRYFCRTCYQLQHNTEESRKHRPLMRNATKPAGTAGAVTSVTFSPFGNRNHNHTHANRSGGFTGNSNNFNNGWGSNGYHQHRRQQDRCLTTH